MPLLRVSHTSPELLAPQPGPDDVPHQDRGGVEYLLFSLRVQGELVREPLGGGDTLLLGRGAEGLHRCADSRVLLEHPG